MDEEGFFLGDNEDFEGDLLHLREGGERENGLVSTGGESAVVPVRRLPRRAIAPPNVVDLRTVIIDRAEPRPLPFRIPLPRRRRSLEEIRMRVDEFETDAADELEPMIAPPLARSFVHRRLIGAVTGAVGSFITGGNPLAGAVGGFARGGAAPGGTAGRGGGLGVRTSGSLGRGLVAQACPPGTRQDASGRCAETGLRGAARRAMPLGRTGFQPRVNGDGLLGLIRGGPEPAMEVGTITRNDGSVGPILRCPAGMVLAVDDQCYAKGLKGLAAFRKWPPGTKPFLTGGDVKVLRRANTLRRSKGTKKLLKELGLG